MAKTITIVLLLIWTSLLQVKGKAPYRLRLVSKNIFANSLVALSLYPYFEHNPCYAREMVVDSKSIFINSCSGCHSNGGNILNPAKTLKKEDLIKFDLFEKSKLSTLISQGRDQMPAYGEFISPKGNLMPAKLSPSEIDSLSDYIIDMAEKNWPSGSEVDNLKNCDEYPGC